LKKTLKIKIFVDRSGLDYNVKIERG